MIRIYLRSDYCSQPCYQRDLEIARNSRVLATDITLMVRFQTFRRLLVGKCVSSLSLLLKTMNFIRLHSVHRIDLLCMHLALYGCLALYRPQVVNLGIGGGPYHRDSRFFMVVRHSARSILPPILFSPLPRQESRAS
jgi:hypothetical protein